MTGEEEEEEGEEEWNRRGAVAIEVEEGDH